MPDHAHLTAFLAAALVLAITPGPGIFYVLARSLGEGTRVGVRSTAIDLLRGSGMTGEEARTALEAAVERGAGAAP